MEIGFVGLGRLGFPVAVALAWRGHKVTGYDLDPGRRRIDAFPGYEAGLPPDGPQKILSEASPNLAFSDDMAGAVRGKDLTFFAIQTPHAGRFGGTYPLTPERLDFDYSYLVSAIDEAARECTKELQRPTFAVISTVLPGTIRERVLPILEGREISLIYNPFLIAMGTTLADFLKPEIIIVGADRFPHPPDGVARLAKCYGDAGVSAPWHLMSIESAETTKVLYNTFISSRLAVVNVMAELCDKVKFADVDEVSDALENGTQRVAGPAYLRGGMGDGGACHPRDNIAMSFIARKLGLHHDVFTDAMTARERHARQLAGMLAKHGLPVRIAGYAYKPGTPLTDGSHALLVRCYLDLYEADVSLWDPMYDGAGPPTAWAEQPGAYLIGCPHTAVIEMRFPPGSVVIDPYRIIADQEGVSIARIGEASRCTT